MKALVALRCAALALPICIAAPAVAQQAEPPSTAAPQTQTAPEQPKQPAAPEAAGLPGWGPGAAMGPWMTGRGAPSPVFMRRFCNPRFAGFRQWRANRLERRLDLTDAQKAKLDDLKAASAKAVQTITASCPSAAPGTPVEQMQAMESRLEAMLQAIKTVRPAFDAFYASLSDQQKAQLYPRSRWREYGRGPDRRR